MVTQILLLKKLTVFWALSVNLLSVKILILVLDNSCTPIIEYKAIPIGSYVLHGPDRLSSCMTQNNNQNWGTCTKIEAQLQFHLCKWMPAFEGVKDELNLPVNQFLCTKEAFFSVW